jgi:membrane-bound lytic murein transglycosylase A
MFSFPTRRSVPPSFAIVAAAGVLMAACQTAPEQPRPQPQPPTRMPPPVGPISVPTQPAQPSPPAQPQQPAAPLFTPVAFDALPGWQQDDLRQAWPAFQASCRALAARAEWKAPCAAGKAVDAGDGTAIRRFFETYFVPNLIRAADGADTGLITGYYEPASAAARSRRRSTRCRTT